MLAADIEDHPENTTRFVLVARDGIPPPTGHDKTTHRRASSAPTGPAACSPSSRSSRPGPSTSTKLESRPTKKGLGDYCFIIDLEGHVADELVADCLRDLRAKVADVKFLGSYPAAGEHGPAVRRDAEEAWRDGRRLDHGPEGQARSLT